jgi:hypothetical protein
MRAVAAGLLITLLCAASIAAQQPQAGARPVATVKQLHDVLITPASDAVFQAAGETPANAKAWDAARNQALEGAGDSITVACETCHQPYRDGGRQMRGNAR